MKFSIIIPIYNEEKYIERCLDSVFAQTIDKSQYEVIVIDDGSTDNSVNILKEYPVTILNSPRVGAGGARNRGLDVAKGQYIILLDGDDYFYQKDTLEKLEQTLNNQDIVFVKYKQILGEDEKIFKENYHNSLEEQIYQSNYFCCTLKCFKGELVKGVRYKERCFHEDISFTMELMCKAKSLCYFDEILYVYDKQENHSTIDDYTIRKALDFTNQVLEYLYLANQYKDKTEALMIRIQQEKYLSKIEKLCDWVKNDTSYSYHKFLE